MKVARSGDEVCVSIKSGANRESRLFCPFSEAKIFGANSQPLSFSASKAARLHGAKRVAALRNGASAKRIWIHNFFSLFFFPLLSFLSSPPPYPRADLLVMGLLRFMSYT